MKRLVVNYDPTSSENLKSDSSISREVDGLISDLSFSGNKEVTVSQWTYVDEFLYRYVKGEIARNELIFMHKGQQILFDDLGFFINEPKTFKSPASSLVNKINELRMEKLNKEI